MQTRCPHCGRAIDTTPVPREKPNAERDAEIVKLNRDRVPLEQIAAKYGIGPTRVRQIVLRLDPQISLQLSADQQQLRLRNQAIFAWRKTGMTYRAIGERYGIGPDRVREIVMKAEQKERWREAIKARSQGHDDRV